MDEKKESVPFLQIERFDLGRWWPEHGMAYTIGEKVKAAVQCDHFAGTLGMPCRVVSVKGEQSRVVWKKG